MRCMRSARSWGGEGGKGGKGGGGGGGVSDCGRERSVFLNIRVTWSTDAKAFVVSMMNLVI